MNSTEINHHEIISKAAKLQRIEDSEAYVLSRIREDYLSELSDVASQIGDHLKGKQISFSPKVFISPTCLLGLSP